MALSMDVPPWLNINPNFFTSALESGARVGLGVAEMHNRAAQLAEASAERQAQQAERAREFEQTRLLNVQKIAQDAAQLQQQIAHQTAQEANQQAQESRLLDYDKGRLAVENRQADTAARRAAAAEKAALPSALDTTLVPALDPATGARIGLMNRSGPKTQHYIPDRATDLQPSQEVAGLRARASLLEQQYMINNPPKGSAEEKRISDALLTIDKRLESLTTGKGDTNAPTVGATGRINPLPSKKDDLITGNLYDTKRGVARWNGTAFEKVSDAK